MVIRELQFDDAFYVYKEDLKERGVPVEEFEDTRIQTWYQTYLDLLEIHQAMEDYKESSGADFEYEVTTVRLK